MDWQIGRKWSCVDVICADFLVCGGSHWFPELLEVHIPFLLQRVLHLEPSKNGFGLDLARPGLFKNMLPTRAGSTFLIFNGLFMSVQVQHAHLLLATWAFQNSHSRSGTVHNSRARPELHIHIGATHPLFCKLFLTFLQTTLSSRSSSTNDHYPLWFSKPILEILILIAILLISLFILPLMQVFFIFGTGKFNNLL